ncbi:MAG TPA: Hsp33 family molecular chaperone HslO [Woeseiaceae bacterium]
MAAQYDVVMPFVFEALPIRGAIIQLQKSWHRMLLGHEYDQPVLETLGHSAAASALIAQSLKFDGSITLQISGNGPLAMLVMQCTSNLELRGMASAERLGEDIAFTQLVQKARCAITVDAGVMDQPYQGIVEVSGDSLADSIEDYYERSAQIPTHLQLVSDRNCCGGILLQQMPGEKSPVADDWRRLGLLAATLHIRDVADGLTPALLSRLFAEDDLRVFRPREAQFRCRCSRRRTEDVLKLLGEQDTRDLLAEQGRIDVTCEYCGRTRTFDSIDVSQIFTEPHVPPSDTVH